MIDIHKALHELYDLDFVCKQNHILVIRPIPCHFNLVKSEHIYRSKLKIVELMSKNVFQITDITNQRNIGDLRFESKNTQRILLLLMLIGFSISSDHF